MINELEVREKLASLLPGYKPNPNHFMIITKWNNRIFQKHKFEIWDYLESVLDEELDWVPPEPKTGCGTLVDCRKICTNQNEYRVSNYGQLYFKPEEKDAEL